MKGIFSYNLIGIIISLISGIIAFIITNFLISKESKSIKKETEETLKDIQNQSDYDVFKLLYKNVRESTEYYIISKRQANKSFILAIMSCVFGILIYICGFIIISVFDKDIIIFTTIAGSVVELITGLSFWVYNKCIKQLSEYHKRLSLTEKYLTSIQMADKISESGREEMYKWLIQNVILLDLDYYKTKQNKNKNETQ